MTRKPALALLALAAILLLGIQPAHAMNATTASRQITVTGEAEVRVPPDEVVLILGVETWDKDIQAAKKQNDDRVGRIIALAKQQGVQAQYIQTDRINVEPRYRNGTYADADFIGYFVRKTAVITLKDVNRFEDLYTAALAAGANHALGVDFRTSELRKHRDAARDLAIQAAKEKAVALAGKLGLKVGQASSIQENQNNWYSSYGSRWGGSLMTQNVIQNSEGFAASSGSEAFAPGQISVNARVTVTFDLD